MTTATTASSWDVLRTLTQRQVRLRRQRAWFAFAWPALAPLALLALYVFVFRSVFDVRIPHYPTFLFAGLLPWSFLALSVGTSLQSITMEPELVRKSRFRYELLPIATVLGLAIPTLAMLIAFVIYLGVTSGLHAQLLPLLIVPVSSLLLFTAGVSVVLALIDVYNRDLRHVIGNLLTIWFFLVPIVYRHEMTPRGLHFLRSVDPMNLIVGEFRDVLFWGRVSHPLHFAFVAALSAAWFVLAMVLFSRFRGSIPKDL